MSFPETATRMEDPLDSHEPLKRAVALKKAGDRVEMLAVLRRALRRGRLEDEAITRAGALINDALAVEPEIPWVFIAGQCTTSWLATTLTAIAWERQTPLRTTEAGYDTVLQSLHALQGEPRVPDAVVLLPWGDARLRDRARSMRQRIDDEIAFWRQAWDIARPLPSRVIQIGYGLTGPGAAGYHMASSSGGDVDLVRRLNDELRAAMPAHSFFVDLEQVAADIGRSQLYDARQYAWTKQPFGSAGLVRVAQHVAAGYRALTHGPKKVLVLDLDDTVWGGVVGEVGASGIELGGSPAGEAFLAVQRHARDLARRGVLLAACTRNDEDDARAPFEENPDMVLRLSDFAVFDCGWDGKADRLRRIAQTLNLGLDSFVFIDDNPAEREHVRQALPEVDVVELPADPAEWVATLERGLWFESACLTADDLMRASHYQAESARDASRQPHATLDEYLQSLDMHADIRPVDDADLPRVVQLIGKTNQFNLTSRRHAREAVVEMIGRPGTIALTERLRDRFGDYGLVAVIIGVRAESGQPGAIRIDTWLMSCRVIGRTAEHRLFAQFVERAAAVGYQRIDGEFRPTAKNVLVSGLFESLWFARVHAGHDGTTTYTLALRDARPPDSFVR